MASGPKREPSPRALLTGAAERVTNSVERAHDHFQHHPENFAGGGGSIVIRTLARFLAACAGTLIISRIEATRVAEELRPSASRPQASPLQLQARSAPTKPRAAGSACSRCGRSTVLDALSSLDDVCRAEVHCKMVKEYKRPCSVSWHRSGAEHHQLPRLTSDRGP